MDAYLYQHGPGAKLSPGASKPGQESGCDESGDQDSGVAPLLAVRYAAPGWWDLCPAPSWPRVPGGVMVLDHAAFDSGEESRTYLCGGYLPCGGCPACRAGLHLACAAPTRTGWNTPGGFASAARLRPEDLAPVPGDGVDDDAWPWAVAVVAAGGPTYQAAAAAGMAPGDVAVVFGSTGPGAIPLRVLSAMGLRTFWVIDDDPDDARGADPSPPAGVEVSTAVPAEANLLGARCHVLDLAPTRQSLQRWEALARGCLSCTLVGAPPPPRVSTASLGGQATLRWVRDLHPHLALDLVGLCTSGRLQEDATAYCLCDMDQIPAAFAALERREGAEWPVLRR